MSKDETPEDERALAEAEAAAAAEAGNIGGPGPEYGEEDASERPLAEAGEGEAEGFELAEQQLEDIAAHGDQHRFPGRDAPGAEEDSGATYGEADEEMKPDA